MDSANGNGSSYDSSYGGGGSSRYGSDRGGGGDCFGDCGGGKPRNEFGINAQSLLRAGDGPIVLVIAPTRELAMQIEQECAKLSQLRVRQSAAAHAGEPTARRRGDRDLRMHAACWIS